MAIRFQSLYMRGDTQKRIKNRYYLYEIASNELDKTTCERDLGVFI